MARLPVKKGTGTKPTKKLSYSEPAAAKTTPPANKQTAANPAKSNRGTSSEAQVQKLLDEMAAIKTQISEFQQSGEVLRRVNNEAENRKRRELDERLKVQVKAELKTRGIPEEKAALVIIQVKKHLREIKGDIGVHLNKIIFRQQTNGSEILDANGYVMSLPAFLDQAVKTSGLVKPRETNNVPETVPVSIGGNAAMVKETPFASAMRSRMVAMAEKQ